MQDKELFNQLIDIDLLLYRIARYIPDQKHPDALRYIREIENAVVHMYVELKYYKNLVEDNNNAEA